MGTTEGRSDAHVRIREVADDTFQLRLPLPIPGLSHVNMYALRDGDEWALVDAGWPSEKGWAALKDALHTIGCPLDKIAGVWLTHLHPDHMGLADRFLQVGIHVAASARALQTSGGIFERFSTVGAEAWRLHGVPDKLIATLKREIRWERTHLSESIFTLEDVDTLHVGDRAFRVVYTPGHAAAHVCLFEEGARLLFAGDHLLPNTTPHIGLLPGEAGNPLQNYLASLARIGRLPVGRVLPGHGDAFGDPSRQIAATEAHHADRLEDAQEVVAQHPGATTYEVAQHMRWSIAWEAQDPFSHLQALTEALAHLVELERRGKVDGLGEHGWEART